MHRFIGISFPLSIPAWCGSRHQWDWSKSVLHTARTGDGLRSPPSLTCQRGESRRHAASRVPVGWPSATVSSYLSVATGLQGAPPTSGPLPLPGPETGGLSRYPTYPTEEGGLPLSARAPFRPPSYPLPVRHLIHLCSAVGPAAVYWPATLSCCFVQTMPSLSAFAVACVCGFH